MWNINDRTDVNSLVYTIYVFIFLLFRIIVKRPWCIPELVDLGKKFLQSEENSCSVDFLEEYLVTDELCVSAGTSAI